MCVVDLKAISIVGKTVSNWVSSDEYSIIWATLRMRFSERPFVRLTCDALEMCLMFKNKANAEPELWLAN